jgi:hypothetical protein
LAPDRPVEAKRPKRFLASFQSTGRIGKSTVNQGIMSYMAYAGLEFAAIDADGDHKTLSRWYPDLVAQMPFRAPEDILPILDEVGVISSLLVDYPAQATVKVLESFAHFNVIPYLASKDTRLTILVYASDERPAMSSADQILRTFGDDAEYIVVENKARFSSDIFNASSLAARLREKNAPVLVVPPITRRTIDTIDSESVRARKMLTFREAEEKLPDGLTLDLQAWRNQLFAQLESMVELLSPLTPKQHVQAVKQMEVSAESDYFTL